jgi:hypothetical protein
MLVTGQTLTKNICDINTVKFYGVYYDGTVADDLICVIEHCVFMGFALEPHLDLHRAVSVVIDLVTA